jgi:putative transposase
VGLTRATVGKWRQRYLEHGIEGLHDELRAGRPRSFEDEQVAEVINRALQTRPPSGTNWSVRGLAADTGVSKSTVQRWFSCSACNRTARNTSSCPTIPSSSRRSAISSACI